MLKAGLVGAGHLGKIHLRLLNQSDKYELVGFHDKDVENGKKLEAEFGYKYFENFDDLLAEIDMLDIVTSHRKRASFFYRKTSNPNAETSGRNSL